VVTVTNAAGASPAWNGTISVSETKLEFAAAAGAVGAIAQVQSSLPAVAPAGESAISLEIKNEGVTASIIKIKIEEQNDAAKYDAKYESLAVNSTQTWTNLFTNTAYKITLWIAPTAGGGVATTKTGYVKVLASPGKIKYDGVGLDLQIAGDVSVQISNNPL
jgi:hypothetical protein